MSDAAPEIEYVSVPTSGPELEEAIAATIEAHANSLPFFITRAQVKAQAEPIIEEFLNRFAAKAS